MIFVELRIRQHEAYELLCTWGKRRVSHSSFWSEQKTSTVYKAM